MKKISRNRIISRSQILFRRMEIRYKKFSHGDNLNMVEGSKKLNVSPYELHHMSFVIGDSICTKK